MGAFPPQSWWFAQTWPPFIASDGRLAASVLELASTRWRAEPQSQLRRKVVPCRTSLANVASTQSHGAGAEPQPMEAQQSGCLCLPSAALAAEAMKGGSKERRGCSVSLWEPLGSWLHTAPSAGRCELAALGRNFYKEMEREVPSSSNSISTASMTGPWVAAAAEGTSRPPSGLHDPTGMPCGSRQPRWLSCPGSPGTAPGRRAAARGTSAASTPSSASSSSRGCCTRARPPVITLMRSGQDSTWEISMYRKWTRTGGLGGCL